MTANVQRSHGGPNASDLHRDAIPTLAGASGYAIEARSSVCLPVCVAGSRKATNIKAYIAPITNHDQNTELANSRLAHGPRSGGAKIGAYFVVLKWLGLPVKSHAAKSAVSAIAATAMYVSVFCLLFIFQRLRAA